ncbi:hypothetical protein A1QO_00705 [Vibrio genomosp. F10 str. ZF-129]|uniref:Phosphoadenosine phosphosulphate reductase domain-containing protein n=1 Tax=Vibrio genomosp. F10 str. ZF-129 TaxID=1187848 RepID=A0A1E5BGC0_9VIBR|nr:phosphoadenosine phosphosulfate reductase family protein [Vibrio genomosp. F10]OEE35312.1 hypothetical protein A1QO_00705 [Vibrio genomosp. F10 str. ZF-129]
MSKLNFEDFMIYKMAIESIKELLRSGNTLIISCSYGKDSTCVLVLFLEAVKQLIAEGVYVPICYVTTSDTRREMPEIHNYVGGQTSLLEVYIAKHNLPIEVVVVEPELSGRFTWTTLGRGVLPTYVGGDRKCAVDEKITPQRRFLKSIESNVGQMISLVGSRRSESVVRGHSMEKYKMSELAVSIDESGFKTFAPIANFDLDDVWLLLCSVAKPIDDPNLLFQTYADNLDELFKLYNSANGGQCGVIFGDTSKQSPCGSRFGCGYCVANSGSEGTDNSLENMIADDLDRYGYMNGLLKFRKFLLAIRWDWNRRDFRGRVVSDIGYLKVAPNYFNGRTRRELFRYLVTLDALERERAEKHEMAYQRGDIEQSKENEHLCNVLFEFISFDDVLAIDFQWSVSGEFPQESFPAAKDYLEVHDLGIRYHIPEIEVEEKPVIDQNRWIDISSELLELAEEGNPLFKRHQATGANLKYDVGKRLSISEGSGFAYLENVRARFYELQHIPSEEVARYILESGFLTLNQSDIGVYAAISDRNWAILRKFQSSDNLSVNEFTGNEQLMTINRYLIENSISNEKHLELLTQHTATVIDEQEEQQDMFGSDSIANALLIEPEKVKKIRKVSTVPIEIFRSINSQIALF